MPLSCSAPFARVSHGCWGGGWGGGSAACSPQERFGGLTCKPCPVSQGAGLGPITISAPVWCPSSHLECLPGHASSDPQEAGGSPKSEAPQAERDQPGPPDSCSHAALVAGGKVQRSGAARGEGSDAGSKLEAHRLTTEFCQQPFGQHGASPSRGMRSDPWVPRSACP